MAGPSAAAVFDPEQPQRFYLPDDEMEQLADATLVVEGVQLPVHSAVLSLQSRVLRGMFVDLQGTEDGSSRGRKRKQPEEPVVLEQPFDDCLLSEVAAFLRCAYSHRSLPAVPHSCLPGVLRLAHRLDATEVLASVAEHMTEVAGSGTALPHELLAWAAAADTCHSEELHASCTIAVARQLASGMDSLPAGADGLLGAITHSLTLEGCSQRTLLLLLRIMTAACKSAAQCPQPQILSCIPTADAVAEALQQSANPGAFEWALESFSDQSTAVGAKVVSPWFVAAGVEWCLKVYPGGHCPAAAGHFSVFLVPKAPLQAKYKLIVVDQSVTAPQSVSYSWEPTHFTLMGRGLNKFVSLEQLRTRGYLAGDRLMLRAEVEVVHE